MIYTSKNAPFMALIRLGLVALVLLLLLGAAGATPAHAVPSTWTVQSPDDDGTAVPANCPGVNCRLRDAIEAAPSGATIDFSSDFTITLVSQIYFEKSLTITAVGRNVNISGGGTTRIFEISGDGITVVFNHLTLMNGNGVDRGAAIYLHYRYGYNTLTIFDSTFHDNHSGDFGGGAINVAYDTLRVYNSTFYNNTSDISAGAIDSGYGNTIIENSTFYNNHTPAYAGALSQAGGSIVLTNNTFVGNGAPQGANVDFITGWDTAVTLNNNIFANGTSGASCACDNGWTACPISGSGNFATDNSCGTGTTVLSPSLAVFGPLASYGGSTQTIPLLPGNPAINGGAAATCAGLQYGNYDQRGLARFGTCDAGSFESQGFTLTKGGGDNQSTLTDTIFASPLTLSVAALSAIEPVAGGKVIFTSPATGAGTNPITNTATIASGGSVSQSLAANSTSGPYTVTASANEESISYSLRNTSQPVITWANPANIVYGTALGATQLNATANVPGTFTYNPAAGTVLNAGTHTLHVDFTPTDTTNYVSTSKDVSITVTQAPTSVTWSNPTDIVYGTMLGGTQLNATASVAGTFTYTPNAGTVLNVGTHTLHVDFTPLDSINYTGSSKDVSITVTQAPTSITWANPADIVYGTTLSSTQLNATASAAGTFTYNPAAGTVLNVGTHTLHVDFIPADTTNYANASKDVSITVTQATPVVTWADPAAIDQGTPLSATQLNATADVPGTFTYTPAAGIYLFAGTYILHVDFVPTDTVNYINASRDASLTVNDHVLFNDVPNSYWARSFIERLYLNQVTGGCGGGSFCPNVNATRAQMAVFVLRAAHGTDFTPPAATGTVFDDVSADSFAAAWIEELAAEGITGGCGNGNYCPNAPVTRAQMAVFLVKAMYGVDYVPPVASGEVFGDVPADGFAAAFIEKLSADGVTSGCGSNNYCPNAYITRAEIAVFLVTAFNLP